MQDALLAVLVCPLCKGPLKHLEAVPGLLCEADALLYPIEDGLPLMLASSAQSWPLSSEDAS